MTVSRKRIFANCVLMKCANDISARKRHFLAFQGVKVGIEQKEAI